jgi:conjugal transfer mating pair stabilization protein TraG|tara:strand:- start:323 stop:4627 length:4305 start_codon:yes stop_codon:yes gene_type:complete
MDSVVIYTFGHLSIFKAVFQALAVLFDPLQTEFFVSDNGMGLGIGATLAAMVAFIGAGFNWFDTEKFAPHTALYGMILYSLLFVPKMPEVWLSDLYTGRTEVVNNVPFGVAVLGNAFSSLSVGISRNFEVQYTSPGAVDGLTYSSNVLSTGAGAGSGFLSPLKSLLFFRHNTFMYLPKHIKVNLIAYQKYCVDATSKLNPKPSPAFDYAQMSKETDPFAYLFDDSFIDPSLNAPTANLAGDQVFLTCEQLQTALSGAGVDSIEYQLGNAASIGLYAYRATATGQNFEEYVAQSQNGGSFDASASITEISSQLTAILSNGENAKNFMLAAMARDIIRLGKDFTGLPPEMLNDYAITMTQAIESSKILQAVEGEDFLKWSMAAMSALQFLFYALTPIVGLAMVAKGAGSFKYLGSYLLFGLWSYSWIPVASAINFWSIGSFMETFNAQDGVMGITPELVELLISQGEEAIAVGANLLAMTPLLTFAILSTGGYAMTALAKSANPNGGASQAAGNLAPALRDNPALAKMKGVGEQLRSGSNVGASNFVNAQNSQHKFGGNADKKAQLASVASYTKSAETSATAARKEQATKVAQVMNSVGSGSSIQSMDNAGLTMSAGLSAGMKELGIDSKDLSKNQREGIMTEISTGANVGKVLAANAKAYNGNDSSVKYSASQIEAAETAFLSNTKLDESYSGSTSDKTSEEIKASFNDGASKVAETGTALKTLQQVQEQETAQINSGKEYTSGVSIDGSQVVANALANPNSGLDGSFESGIGFIAQAYHQEALEQGLSETQATENTNNAMAGLRAQFNSGEKFNPQRDSSSAAAFGTFFDAVKNPGNDPVTNSIMGGTQRSILKNTGNNAVNAPTEQFQGLDDVASKIAKNSDAINKKVNHGTASAPQATTSKGETTSDTFNATQQQLRSGAEFSPSELQPLYDSMKNFDTASNNVTGLTGSNGANYQKSFDQHKDELAQSRHGAKSFSDLTANQARTVAFDAAMETAKDFRGDYEQSLNNNPGANNQHNQNVLKATDALIGNAQQFGHFSKQTSSPIKNEGSIAKGQFQSASNTLNRGTEGILKNKAVNDSVQQENAKNAQDKSAGDIKRKEEQSSGSKLIKGVEGAPLNNNASIDKIFDGHNEALDNGDDRNKVDQNTDKQVESQIRENAQNRTHEPSNQSAVDFNSGGSDGKPFIDAMDANQKAGYSAPQSYAIAEMEYGANTSGNGEKVVQGTMVTAAVAGTVATGIKATGVGKVAAAGEKMKSGANPALFDSSATFLQGLASAGIIVSEGEKQENRINDRDNQSMAHAVNTASNDVARTAQRLYDGGNQEQALTMLKEMSRGMGMTNETLFTENTNRDGSKSLSVNQGPIEAYIYNGGYGGEDKASTPSDRTKILFDASNSGIRAVTGINQQEGRVQQEVDPSKRLQEHESNQYWKANQ